MLDPDHRHAPPAPALGAEALPVRVGRLLGLPNCDLLEDIDLAIPRS